MSKSRSRLISCYCGNSISTWATVTEISIPISSDSLARPPALGRLDYDFPTFFAQREPGSMLGPVVSIRLNWFSLRASTKKRRDQSRVSLYITLVRTCSFDLRRAGGGGVRDRSDDSWCSRRTTDSYVFEYVDSTWLLE